MDERYSKTRSQEIKDTQWIEEATLAGDVLLCKDLTIARNALEAQVIYVSGAGIRLVQRAPCGGSHWAVMAQCYLDAEAKIVEMATRASGPYVMSVNAATGLRRIRLAYPPS